MRFVRVLPIAIAAVGCDAAFGQMLPPVVQPPLLPDFISQQIGELVPYPPGPTFYYSSKAGALINNTGDTLTTAFYAGGKGLATVSISGGNTVPRDAGVQETFEYEVYGPPDAIVPVIEFFSGSVSVDLSAVQTSYAQASFSLGGLLTPTQTIDAGNPNCSGYGASCFPTSNPVPENSFGHVALPEFVITNFPYTITLDVYGVSYGGKVSAMVDPTVTFAPGFDSQGYSLEFSPDAVTAVPEAPSSWLLLAGCLGLLAPRRPRSRPS